MDLVQTVRKEGSRGNLAIGGNVDWSKIASDSQRENYLGHSIHAPVGRWQKGRDLNWYAKANKSAFHIDDDERKQIEEEKRQIKEREAAMMDEMLGIKRSAPPNSAAANANLTPIGPRSAQPNAERDDYDQGFRGRGIGFGKKSGNIGGDRDVLEGEGVNSRNGDRHRSSRHHHRSHHADRRDESRDRRHRHHKHSHRSRSRSREHRSSRYDNDRPRERHYHRSRHYDNERPREREHRGRRYEDERPRERDPYRSHNYDDERLRERGHPRSRYHDEERPRERDYPRSRQHGNLTRSRSPDRRRRFQDEGPFNDHENRANRYQEEPAPVAEAIPAPRDPSWSPRPRVALPDRVELQE